MMDDFDDLLADDGFSCDAREEGKSEVAGRRDPKKNRAKKSAGDLDDVDDLLRELQLESESTALSRKPSARNQQPKASQRESRQSIADDFDNEEDDCWSGGGSKITILGGEFARLGKSASVVMKVASQTVRCLHCDFIVQRWAGKAWSSQVDYMFFRNTAPDRAKMCAQLETRKGYAAYACQCSWVSVGKVQQIRLGEEVDGRSLKWVSA